MGTVQRSRHASGVPPVPDLRKSCSSRVSSTLISVCDIERPLLLRPAPRHGAPLGTVATSWWGRTAALRCQAIGKAPTSARELHEEVQNPGGKEIVWFRGNHTHRGLRLRPSNAHPPPFLVWARSVPAQARCQRAQLAWPGCDARLQPSSPSGAREGRSWGIRKDFLRHGKAAVFPRFSWAERHGWHCRDVQDILYERQSGRCTLRQPRTQARHPVTRLTARRPPCSICRLSSGSCLLLTSPGSDCLKTWIFRLSFFFFHVLHSRCLLVSCCLHRLRVLPGPSRSGYCLVKAPCARGLPQVMLVPFTSKRPE